MRARLFGNYEYKSKNTVLDSRSIDFNSMTELYHGYLKKKLYISGDSYILKLNANRVLQVRDYGQPSQKFSRHFLKKSCDSTKLFPATCEIEPEDKVILDQYILKEIQAILLSFSTDIFTSTAPIILDYLENVLSALNSIFLYIFDGNQLLHIALYSPWIEVSSFILEDKELCEQIISLDTRNAKEMLISIACSHPELARLILTNTKLSSFITDVLFSAEHLNKIKNTYSNNKPLLELCEELLPQAMLGKFACQYCNKLPPGKEHHQVDNFLLIP